MTDVVRDVEKGTTAVISVNFTAYVGRTFNNLRTNFADEIPRKEFFNTHVCLQPLRLKRPDGTILVLHGFEWPLHRIGGLCISLGTVLTKQTLLSAPKSGK